MGQARRDEPKVDQPLSKGNWPTVLTTNTTAIGNQSSEWRQKGIHIGARQHLGQKKTETRGSRFASNREIGLFASVRAQYM
jgi:hypothetical protein